MAGFNKTGFYDWIASFEDLERFLPIDAITSKNTANSLIIGCGTALFAEKLQQSYAKHHSMILATDNDAGCIDHMKASFPDSKVEYIVHDIIEDAGQKFHDEMFDFIFDKGTLDAIHVEGSIALLLSELNRLLKTGGVYVLVSINSEELLSALFSMADLGLSILSTRDIPNTSDCRILLIQKDYTSTLPLDIIAQREHQLTDHFFKAADTSLLSTTKIESITHAFATMGQDSGLLDLKTVHSVVFPSDEGLGYDFELFMDDVQNFSLQRAGFMTMDEVLTFVRAME